MKETAGAALENPPRLLFVDDEPTIRTLLQAILKRRGFDVTVAETVSEALALIATQRFDVLLSDLNIGEAGDGFTVVSAMRRTQPAAATFILTGYPAFESALEAIRQQVDDYFVKPADVDGMIQKIRDALAGRKTQRSKVEPRRLAEVLSRNRRDIFERWLAAAGIDDQIRATKLSSDEIADHLPLLIEEIVAASPDRKLSAKALHAAQQHGTLRCQQGCDVPSIIREARILHDVISRVVHENLLSIEISTLITDIMGVGETIQAFLEESTRSFAQAHDARTSNTSAQSSPESR